MIERYTRPEMGHIWSTAEKFRTWLEVEAAVSQALEERGIVPGGTAAAIRAAGPVDPARVEELEATLNHDVIAFLTAVTEKAGPEARYLHFGMTSSDLLDTALGLTLRRAGMQVRAGLVDLSRLVAARAVEFKDLACVGRTHGIIAEPTTFGLKLLGFHTELERQRDRLDAAVADTAVGKISGAVGTFTHLDPDVESDVCHRLGLAAEPVSTQVVPRDRHAALVTTLAGLSATLERFATEMRNLQRSEISEALEFFGSGQKGSSSMPHKKNPITAERVAGLARVVRGHAVAALENVALWHERDITHSSVERVILPDAFITVDYQIHLTARIVERMVVRPEAMSRNLNRNGGIIFSQRVLLALADGGLSREDAYALVQRNALKAWEEEGSFRDIVENDAEITARLSPEALDDCFDLAHNLRNVDAVFTRVLGAAARKDDDSDE